MLARVVTALILAPAVVALVVFAPPWLFTAAAGLIGTLCVYEYAQLTRAMGAAGLPWFTAGAFWLLLVGLRVNLLPAPLLLGIVVIGAFAAAASRRRPVRERALGLMSDILAVCYLTFCLYPLVAVRCDFGDGVGMRWLILLFAVTWAGDIAAMFVGRSLGRTPFAPLLSPKKTNEGAIAGLAAGVVAAVLLQHFAFPGLPRIHVVAAALLIGAFGQLGDLAESLLKRAAGVKDSSRLIPGHGGVLDRIDSLMFAFPVLHLYLTLLYPA